MDRVAVTTTTMAKATTEITEKVKNLIGNGFKVGRNFC